MARRLQLAVLALPVLASCSLLLDFDSLQAGTGGTGGTAVAAGGSGKGGSGGSNGGTGGEGASAGTGTGGGDVDCPDECFHDDPCLRDGCTPDGGCLTGRETGLVLDGIDATVPADEHFRVTLASGDDAFFLSSFASNEDRKEVTFYRLSATQDAFEPVASLGGLNLGSMGAPVSAAGLTVQPGLGLIHAFVALEDRTGMGARVWHLVMDMSYDVQTPMPAGGLLDGYWAASPYNHPVSLYAGGQVYAAWINADQTVSLADAAGAQKLSAGTRAQTVSLFTASDDEPHVLYAVEGGGVYLQRPGITPYAVSECQDQAGAYLSSSATFSGVTGLWLGTWTKVRETTDADAGYLTTNGRALGCTANGCGSDSNACDANAANNLFRNPATVIIHRPGDPTGLMELVQASPFLTTDGDEVQAGLVLLQQSVDFGTNPLMDPPTVTAIAPPMVLAGQGATPPAYRGPDFPTVGFVPPDRFAVAWTQPAQTAGDELRVQRYRMCLPPP